MYTPLRTDRLNVHIKPLRLMLAEGTGTAAGEPLGSQWPRNSSMLNFRSSARSSPSEVRRVTSPSEPAETAKGLVPSRLAPHADPRMREELTMAAGPFFASMDSSPSSALERGGGPCGLGAGSCVLCKDRPWRHTRSRGLTGKGVWTLHLLCSPSLASLQTLLSFARG